MINPAIAPKNIWPCFFKTRRKKILVQFFAKNGYIGPSYNSQDHWKCPKCPKTLILAPLKGKGKNLGVKMAKMKNGYYTQILWSKLPKIWYSGVLEHNKLITIEKMKIKGELQFPDAYMSKFRAPVKSPKNQCCRWFHENLLIWP